MSKNLKKEIIIGIILIAILILSITIKGIYSRYSTQIDGAGTATIAKWSFKANNTTTKIKNIRLNSIYAKNDLTQDRIAPGTSGSFDIFLDGTGSDVSIDYSIKIKNEKDKPKNLKFSYNGTTKSTLKELEDVLKGQINIKDNTTKTITIYWNWEYKISDNEIDNIENDRIDTLDSEKDYTFDIIITGKQAKPDDSI